MNDNEKQAGRHGPNKTASATQPTLPEGHAGRHGGTLVSLPMSRHHTVGSVSQEAYRTLWAPLPDRGERWQRVRNVGLVLGMTTPLNEIGKGLLGATIIEMGQLGMPEAVVDQHLDNFACLMLWAHGWGFVRWG